MPLPSPKLWDSDLGPSCLDCGLVCRLMVGSHWGWCESHSAFHLLDDLGQIPSPLCASASSFVKWEN